VEQRAHDRGKSVIALEVRHHPRVADHAGYQPLPADHDVERVLLDPISVEKLLRTLTHRIRYLNEQDTCARWVVRQRHLVADLLRGVDENRARRVAPSPWPAASPGLQGAVTTVLSSTRATREVLDALAD
jgi:hypothetical protein